MTELPHGLGAALAFICGRERRELRQRGRLPAAARDLDRRGRARSALNCDRPIPVWANIPILAYLGLRGRCLMCGGSIPFRYFLTEIALAVTALVPLPDASRLPRRWRASCSAPRCSRPR